MSTNGEEIKYCEDCNTLDMDERYAALAPYAGRLRRCPGMFTTVPSWQMDVNSDDDVCIFCRQEDDEQKARDDADNCLDRFFG